jgi:hypothetical protein
MALLLKKEQAIQENRSFSFDLFLLDVITIEFDLLTGQRYKLLAEQQKKLISNPSLPPE